MFIIFYVTFSELQLLIHESQAIMDRFDMDEIEQAAAALKAYKKLIKDRASLKMKLYSQLIAKYENLVKEVSALWF